MNTEETIKLARERAAEMGIRDIVVATTHGGTCLKVAEAFKGTGSRIVAVTISAAFREEGWVMSDEERGKLSERGINVFTGIHALGDNVDSAFTGKYGGKSFSEIVVQTLYRFCQGMKVCVEVALMAADAGLIPVDREIITIAGAGEGADTATVIKPAYSKNFLELEVKEIIAKPR